jgi:hemoglobin
MAPDAQTPYAEIGGLEAVRRIVDRFYRLLDSDERFAAVRALHGPDLSHARQTLLEFLAGWLGGPPLYFQKPEHRCVMSAHAKFPIGAREARQWLACMAQALEESGIGEQTRLRISAALGRVADRMRNQP